ncbi:MULTISPECIES: HlyD family secretion protein [Emticicia]|uniref:HlyD family secretion protein n=1 Tax=Emticicia TaxID=312278 RepID=UPI0007D8BA37|nr:MULTISPECIES: HlyD family efflux transporter periplasmic adaptor subunit [Emticicia]
MQKQLFPSDIIQSTVEAYLPKVAVRSQLIYILILLSIFGILVSLPFIFIDISVQSNGIIRTVSEKTEIKSLISGTVKAVNVSENQNIAQNTTLFVIATDDIDTKLNANSFQKQEKNDFIHDLVVLTQIGKNNIFGNHSTQTPIYTQQLNTFRSQLQENIFHQKKIKKELDADQYLYKEKVIARRELNAKEYEMNRLVAEFESIFQRQLSQWQAELNKHRFDLKQLQSEAKQLTQQKSYYKIKAPIGGNIQQIVGKYEGSYVQIGETLGIISPDSNLIAECYVSPNDIGLLRKNMPVSFQIDAFNYNEWGLVQGKITDIAHDFVVLNEKPIFKVKCQLDKKTLQLKNGYTAPLKKGLTFRARFVVTKRSLYQLLYDKTDDWLNPKIERK